ncbi:hypothetical protein FHW89_004482 [Mucilaginibacter sp. SG564]|nr:hypothetical protein [Mucilaginibacter sp. SG564]
MKQVLPLPCNGRALPKKIADGVRWLHLWAYG